MKLFGSIQNLNSVKIHRNFVYVTYSTVADFYYISYE